MKKHSKTEKPIGIFAKDSINADQSRHVNEIEKTFMLMKRMLEAEIDAGKKGLVINKGKDNEVKVKYETALQTLDRFYSYMGIKGTFSFGICLTCDNFDGACSATDCFGKCKFSASDLKHIYDSCEKHSKRGGGFGL